MSRWASLALARGAAVSMATAAACSSGTVDDARPATAPAVKDAASPVDVAISTVGATAETGPIVVIVPLDAALPDAPTGGETCSRELHPVVRDFRGYGGSAGPRHPDFEGDFVAYKGIVEPTLGADMKPVYANPGPTPATTGPAEFNQWYRDVSGVNLRFDDVVLPLTEDPARPGTFVFDDQSFFPIDGRGWDDSFGHNFHFTTETHILFTYHGGEYFTFRGDDDVFLFINGHLAIDLGGVHPAEEGTVNLDAQAPALGLVRNGVYPMDIFQAERHTTESTFRVETTLACITNVVIR